MRRAVALATAVLTLAACNTDYSTRPAGLTPPTNLTYQLLPSGDPTTPEGIQLRWDPTDDPRVANYVVYSRASGNTSWSRRAETTSAAFQDLGVPDLQYYVTAQAADGTESAPSNAVIVDASNTLFAPSGLTPVNLNRAVQLSWSNNARKSRPALFSYYRVYSTLYDLDRNRCDSTWDLEGTTVSEDFIASGLANGVPRCFAVSAISIDGHESNWPAPVTATPRFDSRNVLLFASQVQLATSGFSFSLPSSGQMGVVLAGNRTDIDFRVDRYTDGSLWLTPVRSGATVALYGKQPIPDLTSISYAPSSGYSNGAIEAVPGYGYVFRMANPDGFYRFGGLRVTNVSKDYVIVDWSYQTDPGNPMLDRRK
jgi:hypothetical protein